jgi:threonine dehydrogenase-like Zn-dependent dehydrogenase
VSEEDDMRGAVLLGDRRIELATFDDPRPGSNDAVIEVKASGLCGSDLRFYRGDRDTALANLGLRSAARLSLGDGVGIIAGHEPSGIVTAVGKEVDPRSVRVGDRVMVHHYAGCGFCDHCRTGWTQMCDAGATVFGTTAHGGHADYMKVPANTLIPLPDELSFSTGAAIACGTGTAYAALSRMNLTGRDTIAIFGQGPVGQSAVQLAASLGATVIAVDIESARLERACAFGAAHAIDSSTTDPVEAIGELTRGKGATLALDASGAASARQAAVRSAGPWGTVGFVGEGGGVTLDVSPDLIRKQLTIIGSYTFSTVGQAECARFIACAGIDVDEIFTDRWVLHDADQAYAKFDKQTSGKAVIEF